MGAVIRTGGKQYRVAEGTRIKVEKLDRPEGEEVTFSDVLMIEDGGESKVGSPLVEGARVTGTVIEHGRGKKQIVYKFKRRKGYRKKQGHRQDYTLVRIDSIAAAPVPEEEETARKETGELKPGTEPAEAGPEGGEE